MTISDTQSNLAEQHKRTIGAPRACFACGRTYLSTPAHNTRFCSTNCVDQYDAGFPSYAVQQAAQAKYADLPDGFMLDCPGCGRPFRSRGLRCCSDKCEREYVRRTTAEAELAKLREASGVSLPKRGKPCQGPGCTKTLPPWTAKGRKNKARFCSARCARKAAEAPEAVNRPDDAEQGSEVPANQALAESVLATEG
jgi:hypothetical protein